MASKFKKGDQVYCSGTGANPNKKYTIIQVEKIEGFWGNKYYYKLNGLPVMRNESRLSKTK